jgi:hypothetical protein
MCFSAEASFTAAAILIPTGAVAIQRAFRKDCRYLAIAALPLFFGLQQLFEGLVWTAANHDNADWIQNFSLAYMFFSWLAWPVWVPFSTYFMEPCRRRHFYLVFAILGGMFGAVQYLPYFVHDGWLTVKFLAHAISYQDTVLFDFIMRREMTNLFFVFVILAPLLTSSKRSVNIFGLLLLLVIVTTYVFFSYAYISVFCFGGAIMSVYLIYMVFRETDGHLRPDGVAPQGWGRSGTW